MEENRGTSGAAICSLVFGILGALCLVPVVSPIVAVVTGAIGRSDIRRSAGRLEGGGLALAGLILGSVTLGLEAIVIFVAVAIGAGIAEAYRPVVEQLEQVRSFADRGDWNGAAECLTGPGSLPKERILSALVEIRDEIGAVRNSTGVSMNAEASRGRLFYPTLKPVVRLFGERGQGVLEMRFEWSGEKYVLTRLEFRRE